MSEVDEPLVAVVCRTPLVAEAMRSAFDGIAAVQALPSRSGTAGLLRSIAPDAVVVEDELDAEQATGFAETSKVPLVHISLLDRSVRVWRHDAWRDEDRGALTPEGIRNIVVAGILERRKM